MSKSSFLVALCTCFFFGTLSAQDLPVTDGWKFTTGDQPAWASPTFNDSSWAPIHVGAPWESQGYANYNGFAWYRLHIVIPSSIKEKAFLKEKLRIDLGKIDDGDEVYLNGTFIGRNGGAGGAIQDGNWNLPRSYTISLGDPRIHWDQENVIAVRVYDHSGDGGMFEGHYGISVMDVTDFITFNTTDPFRFTAGRQFSKKISLQSTSEKYDFTGKLNIRVIDPFSGAVLFKQTIGADFAHNRPFEYTVKTTLPENKSYEILYSFEEGRSKKLVTAKEEIPYILTPAATATPRINGAEIVGTRPGAPFLFRIPATGERPMVFEATGLPATLKLDKQTGIITGALPQKGNYKLKLSAKNKAGVATRGLTILCGEKIGLTPALGWNSWNCWGLSVSDEKVKTSARAMAAQLADHGWTYINIDDGWEDKRDGQGEILPNGKFPDMKGLCDYVHSLGLKIGIYSSPGPRTCGGYLGSYQHEQQDATVYARWGIDYLKYDWCSYGEIAPPAPSLDDYKKPYVLMRQALDKTGRDILYSLCQYGMGDVWKWGGEIGANSWRTTGDIVDTWGSMSGIGFGQDKCAPYTASGNFNDPDMLVVGRVGWGPSLHNSRLSPDEQYTHISLWSLLSAPLLIGCDMSQLDDFTLGLLTNDEVLAVDQDALAKPAIRTWNKDNVQVWVKELKDGSRALGIFNLSEKPLTSPIAFTRIGLPAQVKLRDLWRQQDLGLFKGSYTAKIPAHGVVLLKTGVPTGR
ncbi:MAG TPA: putative Ig domain-containing protein [Puia sp.]|nr:putative Ig domain-containing protein [Puia sp.]